MTLKKTIAVHEGVIVLIDEWQTQFDRPVQSRSYWTTGERYREAYHAEYIGKECTNEAPGLYVFFLDCVPLRIRIETANAVHYEERDIKPPRKHKSGYPWVWRFGTWTLDY